MLCGKITLLFEKELQRQFEGDHYVRTKGVYVNRAFGGNCHSCVIIGVTDAGVGAGKGAGSAHCLS